MNLSLKIVIWDGCLLADKFVYRNHRVREEFDRLYDLHLNGFIEFCLPKAVQAEFYGLLRSGGIAIRTKPDGPMKPTAFAHKELMELFSLYNGIFNLDFLETLQHHPWPLFSNSYKSVVESILRREYGWTNNGQNVIEKYLGTSVADLQMRASLERGRKKPLKDVDDYPIMASAVIHQADIIVTYNLKDFIDPFGRIRVMNLDTFLSPDVQEDLF